MFHWRYKSDSILLFVLISVMIPFDIFDVNGSHYKMVLNDSSTLLSRT